MLTRLSTALIIPAMVFLSSAAAAQDATPQAAADRATAAELEEMLGPIPTPSEPWKICAIEKTLINEHWQQMKQGYEDAAAEYGVEVEVQAARDEADLTGQLAIAEAMLQGDCDAFAVSPLSSSNLQPFLDRSLRHPRVGRGKTCQPGPAAPRRGRRGRHHRRLPRLRCVPSLSRPDAFAQRRGGDVTRGATRLASVRPTPRAPYRTNVTGPTITVTTDARS